MISANEIFKSHLYPSWISSNSIFKKINHVRKVFPLIGIPNFEDANLIDNSEEIMSCALALINSMQIVVNKRILKLDAFTRTAKIGKIRLAKIKIIIEYLRCFNKQLGQIFANKKLIHFTENGKASISLLEDISCKEDISLKMVAGTSIFKIYQKLNLILKLHGVIRLDELATLAAFKKYSSINVPFKKTTINFSSDGSDGVWDIATMSMRGISSCQTWQDGADNNSLKVIGSIVDPFTGVIYMTDNSSFNNYGSKMSRRCVVRYAVDEDDKTPFILLEKMYPAYDVGSLHAFTSSLQKRTKLKIHYAPLIGEKAIYFGSKLARAYVPLSDELNLLNNKYHPYRDSAISFKKDKDCIYSKNIEKLHLDFKKQIPSLFDKAIKSKHFTKPIVKKFGPETALFMSNLRKPNKVAKPSDLRVKKIANSFSEYVCNKSTDKNPFDYLSDTACLDFFREQCKDMNNSEFSEFFGSTIISFLEKNKK